jgi:transcriptional regulator with XRE-family HTH domain
MLRLNQSQSLDFCFVASYIDPYYRQIERTMDAMPFATAMTGNVVLPASITAVLRITQAELASTLGLARDSISKVARMRSVAVQTRLREMLEILNRVRPWAGSELSAYAWYRSQSLPSFGDMTAEQLVRDGRAQDVRHYLDRIAMGGFA